MESHEWKDQTEEGKRFYRANYHGREWRILTMLKNDENWEVMENPEKDIWQSLRLIVWNKYQRRRCPFERVEMIDKIIESFPEK